MSSDGPKLSVVLPVHNGGPFLGECIDSILANNFHDMEIVVLDNGSTDETSSILESYSDKRLMVLRHDTIKPMWQSWTEAVQSSRGQYLKLVCADDLVRIGIFETQVRILDRYPSVVMTTCRRAIVDSNGRQIIKSRGLSRLRGVVPGEQGVRVTFRAGTNIFGEPACVMFRADVLKRILPWSSIRPYVIDLDMYTRALKFGDLYADPVTLAAFRVARGSESIRMFRQQSSDFRSLMAEASSTAHGLNSVDRALGSVRSRLNQYGRTVLYRLSI